MSRPPKRNTRYRFGTSEEAASAAIFLMTNKRMNGAVLNIDGGSWF